MSINYLEYVGYLASLLVAVSLMMRSIVRLRWVNTAGAATFVFYGLAIGSYPVALMNLFIIGINLYYLHGMYSKKEYFKILPLHSADGYFQEFLAFHKDEIAAAFPDYTFRQDARRIRYLILRDVAVAGVFVGTPQADGSLRIDLDFVVPAYRDFKPGRFLYHSGYSDLKKQGFSRYWAQAYRKTEQNYFLKMGSAPSPNQGNTYEMKDRRIE